MKLIKTKAFTFLFGASVGAAAAFFFSHQNMLKYLPETIRQEITIKKLKGKKDGRNEIIICPCDCEGKNQNG